MYFGGCLPGGVQLLSEIELSFRTSTIVGGGIVAYPVGQAYGSLVLRIIWRLLKYITVSASVPSTSQPKKHTHSSQWVLLGEDLVISPICEVGVTGSIPKRTNCERA